MDTQKRSEAFFAPQTARCTAGATIPPAADLSSPKIWLRAPCVEPHLALGWYEGARKGGRRSVRAPYMVLWGWPKTHPPMSIPH